MNIPMNKVDQHVKQALLDYPTLYTSRMAVLASIFLHGIGDLAWGTDGGLHHQYVPRMRTSMDYSDLDKRNAENEAEITKDSAIPDMAFMMPLYMSRRAALKREYAVRRLIEEDLDVYATEHVLGENSSSKVDWLAHYYPNAGVMRHIDFDNIDLEWAKAAEEIFTIARDCVWRKLGMYSENYSREWSDPKMLTMYDHFVDVINKLDKATGTKAQAAKNMESVTAILEKVIAESKAGK